MLDKTTLRKIQTSQGNEITEHIIYTRLASVTKIKEHKEILGKIADEELKHHDFFKGLTQREVQPNRLKILLYVFISRFFGLNFGLKLMERGEDLAQDVYEKLKVAAPEIEQIVRKEKEHEYKLIDLIDEERIKYVSSIVLGLNDALVELTGALAGFTLALQNTRLVGIVGLITGIAASMSMAASEYLSTKQEKGEKNPLKASIYTGIAYVGAVLFLIFPYLLFKNIFLCLALVVINALFIVIIFTFYISVAKSFSFRKRFLEMAGISLSIAAINFLIGLAIRKIFGIDV